MEYKFNAYKLVVITTTQRMNIGTISESIKKLVR